MKSTVVWRHRGLVAALSAGLFAVTQETAPNIITHLLAGILPRARRAIALALAALFLTAAMGSAAAQVSSGNNYWLSAPKCSNIENLTVSLYVTQSMIAEWTGGGDSGTGFGIQLNANPFPGQIAPNGQEYNWLQYVMMIHADQAQAMVEYWYPNNQYVTYPTIEYLSSDTIQAGSILSIQLTSNSNGYVSEITYSVTNPNGVTTPLQMQPIFIGESTPLLVQFESFQVDIVGPWDSQDSTFSSGQGYITYTASDGPLSVGNCPTGYEPAERSNVYYGPMVPGANSTVTQGFASDAGASGTGIVVSHLNTTSQTENEVYYLGFDSNLYRLGWDWSWALTPATGINSPSKDAPAVAPGTGAALNVNTAYDGNEAFYITNVDGNLHIEQLWGVGLAPNDLTHDASGTPVNVAQGTGPVSYFDSTATLNGVQGTDNVFYLGTDQQAHALTWSASGLSWEEEASLDSAPGPAAASGSSFSGHATLNSSCADQAEEVFYIGTNQHVYERWRWSASAKFDGWHLTDVTEANSSKPVAAVGSPLVGFYDCSGQIDAMFYVGTNQHLYELLYGYDSQSIWQSIDLTQVTGAPAVASGSMLAVHVNTESNPSVEEVFFLDSNNNVWEVSTYSTSATSWGLTAGGNPNGNLTASTGAGSAFPGTAISGNVSTIDNTDHVFYVGLDMDIHELWWNGSWHAAVDDNTSGTPTAPGAVP